MPIGEALGSFGQAFLNFDFRTVRTFSEQFVPGRVTGRYLGGHRKPYAAPLRAAITSSLILVVAAAVLGPDSGGPRTETSLVDDLSFAAREYLTIQQLVALPFFAMILVPLSGRREAVYARHLTVALYFLAMLNSLSLLLYLLYAMLPAIMTPGLVLGVISGGTSYTLEEG
jgi:hypothetical protein